MSASEYERGLCGAVFVHYGLQTLGIDAALLCRLCYWELAGECPGDHHFRARLAVEPRVGIETGKRASCADRNQSRSTNELGTGVSPVELLRNRRSPTIQEVGAERDYQCCRGEIEPRPRDTVGGRVGRDGFGIDAGVVAHVGGHAEVGEPLIQKRRERSRLMLVDEHGIGRATTRARLTQLLREELERLVPLDRDQLAIPPNHRRAVAIRVV